MEVGLLTVDTPGQRVLMMGNVAIARGALEAGVQVATSYPGTPSSEIIGSLCQVARQAGIYVEWSTNEMVAFEVAFAASLAGVRSIVACKHLGMNWIADPFLVSAYTGVNGGLIIVVADDPHPYSSQNAEDTRYYAKLAKVPCLEPSDVQEAKDVMALAFELSETLQLPVMVRITPRIAHTRGIVVLGSISRLRRKANFEKDSTRYVMISSNARNRHAWLNKQYARAAELAETFQLNRLKLAPGATVGVIGCGLSYGYVREALHLLGAENQVSILKLATVNPLPTQLVCKLLSSVTTVLIVEEIDPVIETDIRSLAQGLGLNLEIRGRLTNDLPRELELTPDIVTAALARIFGASYDSNAASNYVISEINNLVTRRTPFLCAGCPHRASYYAIKQALKKVNRGGIVTGDRGCYNQGIHPPLKAIDTCICMGASIAMACGFSKVGIEEPIVAVIGDSTFFHAGIPALINAVYNHAKVTVVILDNGWTAMTGHQPNPATGITAMGDPTKMLKPEELAMACGVDHVKVVDPYNVKATIDSIVEAINHPEPSVVVCRHICTLQELRTMKLMGIKPAPYSVNLDECTSCKLCLFQLGCPAMAAENGKVKIDTYTCVGCGVCAQVCPVEAIRRGS
ncbi:MAG: indolepyruvate ferredoxin oxidoreductase subunit alpha [Candidatus Bathyarchaeia archaeon]